MFRFLLVDFLKKLRRYRLFIKTWRALFNRAKNRKPIEKLDLVIWKLFVNSFQRRRSTRKRNARGAVYDDPRIAVAAGRVDGVGAQAEA